MIGMGRRRHYSEADREAAQARDAAIAEKAEDALADPNLGARIAGLLETPALLRYSVRNQALLMAQASERGTLLTHVETFSGWHMRGRRVRDDEAKQGYRMVKPITRRGSDSGNGEGGEGKKPRPLFRTKLYFDISQTEPIEDWDGETEKEPTTADLEPAVVLFDSLTKQAERLGYQVTRIRLGGPSGQHAQGVHVDEEFHDIHVYGEHKPETLGQLAGVVAELTAHRPKAPRADRPADGSGESRPAKGRTVREDDELVISVY